MEFLLPRRFLALLGALILLAGGVYMADGQRRAAVIDTVWGLADRVAALIVPGDVEEWAGGQAGRPVAVIRSTATATFTPPVMAMAEFEREREALRRQRRLTPAATPTATPTPTRGPTPTPPPTPGPRVEGEPEVSITLNGMRLEITAVVPPVVYVWYEYDAGRWEERQARVSDPVVLESIWLTAQALNAPDVIVAMCWPDNCWAERSTREDSTYVVKVVVNLDGNPPLLDPRVRWRVRFSAYTAGTAWGDGHTNPRGLYGEKIVRLPRR